MGIYRDKESGNWGIRVEYYGREFKKIISSDKRKAELAYKEIKQEIQLKKLANQRWDGFGKLQRAKAPRTFAQAATDYLEERSNYKQSSLASYKSILKQQLLPEFKSFALTSITDSQLKKFQAKLTETVSASRANTIMQLLRSILDQEFRAGEIDRDPSKSVRRLQEPKTKVDPLSEDELEFVLCKIDEHYRPLFTTLAFTGARPNEIIALRWSDIDWNKETISITKGRVRGAEGLPKTKSSERVLPMNPRVRDAIASLKQRPLFDKNGHIFITPKGNPIDKHLDRIWARALSRARLSHRPSYQLRHTFATQCIVKGFPLPFIAKILGHSTIDTLIRHYAGWIDSATNEQEMKLRQAFREAAPKQPTPKMESA